MDKLTAKQFAEACTSFVNSFNPPAEEFIAAMNCEHRTLQQSFTRLCLQWLENCAKDDYRTDGRNDATHRVTMIMINAFLEKQAADFPGTEMAPSRWLPFV